MLNNLILQSAARKCAQDHNKSLRQALAESHAFRLGLGSLACRALERVVDEGEWDTLKGPDAVAALELADKI